VSNVVLVQEFDEGFDNRKRLGGARTLWRQELLDPIVRVGSGQLIRLLEEIRQTGLGDFFGVLGDGLRSSSCFAQHGVVGDGEIEQWLIKVFE